MKKKKCPRSNESGGIPNRLVGKRKNRNGSDPATDPGLKKKIESASGLLIDPGIGPKRNGTAKIPERENGKRKDPEIAKFRKRSMRGKMGGNGKDLPRDDPSLKLSEMGQITQP